jgi:hypothetical protein
MRRPLDLTEKLSVRSKSAALLPKRPSLGGYARMGLEPLSKLASNSAPPAEFEDRE